MSVNIAATSVYANTATSASKTEGAKKPVWNPNKVYKYLEDMNQGFQDYKMQAVSYYSSMISRQEGDGTLSVEDLKKEIQDLFPEYTLTDREPKLTQGKFYLYIDQSQLKKMAEDPTYRAKVYGLMDSELQGKKGFTLEYSDGRKVTSHLTGSVFSLTESNRKYAGADGIPYLGSCMSDGGYSSSSSHPQVRSMSFLYDHIDPAKSAAKDRKAGAVKSAAEKLAEKRAEKRAQEKKEKRKAELKELYSAMRYSNSGMKYQNATDILSKEAVQESKATAAYKNMNEYLQYLRGKYDSLRNGIVNISKSFLRECLKDEEKAKKLEEMLGTADDVVRNAEENMEGLQWMKIRIDKDGNMEIESQSGKVSFNEEKRARQLASAKNPAQVKAVLAMLAKDLSDCEAGLRSGMCDENEVAKVKAMIGKAQQKLSQVAAEEASPNHKEEAEGADTFSLNMLM